MQSFPFLCLFLSPWCRYWTVERLSASQFPFLCLFLSPWCRYWTVERLSDSQFPFLCLFLSPWCRYWTVERLSAWLFSDAGCRSDYIASNVWINSKGFETKPSWRPIRGTSPEFALRDWGKPRRTGQPVSGWDLNPGASNTK
jgi:hypothetical protein